MWDYEMMTIMGGFAFGYGMGGAYVDIYRCVDGEVICENHTPLDCINVYDYSAGCPAVNSFAEVVTACEEWLDSIPAWVDTDLL